MKFRSIAMLLLAASTVSGCARVTIVSEASVKVENKRPDYSKKQDFFLFGIIGEEHVDVLDICFDKPVVKMQTLDTFSDRLISSLTLGIYTPRTARVWCGGKS